MMGFKCPLQSKQKLSGLSSKTSAYGMSVPECNTQGDSEVEEMTPVPLLSQEEHYGFPVGTAQCFPSLSTVR